MKLRIKIVPDTEPNAPGAWREIENASIPFFIDFTSTRWSETAAALAPYCPVGYHIVQYETVSQ